MLFRRRALPFAAEQRALAMHAPAVAGDRAVPLEHSVTRNENCDSICADGLRDLAGIAGAELCGERTISRGLARRDFAQHRPDLFLVVAAARVKRDVRFLVRMVD